MQGETYSNQIKSILENSIDELYQKPELYAKNPGKDFIRNRKLGFKDLIKFLIGMGGNTINKEIYDYFRTPDNIMTCSAFIQQRNKLKPEALKYLFDSFNLKCEDKATYEGYHLYAVDGSDINIAYNENSETHCNWMKESIGIKGFNQFHLNAMYDVLNKVYVDCLIQARPKANERAAAIDMAKRINTEKPAIIIADRGYESLNLFETINRINNLEYLIRIKNSGWLKEIDNLPLKQLDKEISFQLRTTQTKKDKKLFAEGKAKWIAGPSKSGKERCSMDV